MISALSIYSNKISPKKDIKLDHSDLLLLPININNNYDLTHSLADSVDFHNINEVSLLMAENKNMEFGSIFIHQFLM